MQEAWQFTSVCCKGLCPLLNVLLFTAQTLFLEYGNPALHRWSLGLCSCAESFKYIF